MNFNSSLEKQTLTGYIYITLFEMTQTDDAQKLCKGIVQKHVNSFTYFIFLRTHRNNLTQKKN